MVRFSMPRWLGPVLWATLGGGFYLFLPWALARLANRHGWEAAAPGLWNWFGLAPVVVGLALVVGGLASHFRSAKGGWDVDTAKRMTPSYLLRGSIYAWTRNPMYLGGLFVLAGWAWFYGSFAVLAVAGAFAAFVLLVQVPLEERALERRWGEAYIDYKRRVPRWVGRRRGR